MKAIILAAGIGKRMAPIRKDKCLLKFLGKELILHQITLLEKCGIREFIIICNPRNIEKIKELVGNKAEYVVQQEAQGMADALLSVRNPPKEALVLNADDIMEKGAYDIVLKKKEGDSVLLGHKVKSYFPGGYLIAEGDRVKGIIEKPGAGNEPSDLVNIVVHLHRKFDRLLKAMRETKSERDDVYERAMDKLMKESDFRVAPYEGRWAKIKYPWDVLSTMDFFLATAERRISPNAKISDKAVVEGNVIIEDGVRVFEFAIIKGPCYIGKNCVIGSGSLIRGGVEMGEGSIVGSEVKHSYLGEHVGSHQNYIGDSIVMDNSNLGAGARTANWRFDAQSVKVKIGEKQVSTGMEKFGCIIGENCRIGINASIMPGVKIGPDSIAGAGLLISEDLGPGRFAVLKQTIEEKENALKKK